MTVAGIQISQQGIDGIEKVTVVISSTDTCDVTIGQRNGTNNSSSTYTNVCLTGDSRMAKSNVAA